MFLDPQTRRNLELLEGSGGKAKTSLVAVLDQTRTSAVDFVLEKAFVESGEPLLFRVTFTDGSGDAREASVATRLQATGGGL